ncbi:ion channel nompc, putative [Talaromyces stipitatus ATCC 10500]|uniref:Ion channel nompc, putative n=1 Tax=Talaromyces stipitatus (strain ATCC 10500 / CBS 375.48 / QM 6759 / NRRL 1006) TaxID=441959 RepID=B8MDU7_TALSN|nr:ion channel nompc, putative [Talaromyces stipitatus ATCC 10500]EED18326.1 ion channel nompc, putative [Talaromyces stipitatus ATCC 10500]
MHRWLQLRTKFSPEENTLLGSLSIIDRADGLNYLKRNGDRVPGTCEWIMDTQGLQTWLGAQEISTEINPTILWLHGNPGIGKTTMATTIADVLTAQPNFIRGEALLAALYLLRGLLRRLIEQRPRLMKYLRDKFEERKEKLFDSFDRLWNILIDIANGNTGKNPDLHFFITSRPHPEIRDYLWPFKSKDLSTYRKIEEDLQIFIEHKVTKLSRARSYSANVTQAVRRIRSRDEVEKLRDLPKGLNSLYEKLLRRALENNNHKDKSIALQVPGVVAISRHPLSVAKLSTACRLYEEKDEEDRLKFCQEDIKLCRFMIVVQDDTVRLLHKSVKDFLLRAQEGTLFNELKANAIFLVPRDFRLSMLQQDGGISYLIHFALDRVSGIQGIQLSFTDDLATRESMRRFLGSWNKQKALVNLKGERGRTPLHWAIMSHHSDTIDVLLQRYADTDLMDNEGSPQKNLIDAKDAHGQTPLLIAAKNLHLEIIYHLINAGAHVDTIDNMHQNALHLICKSRQLSENICSLLQFLIEQGTPISACDINNMAPILYAIENGSEDLATLFIESGVDIYLQIHRQHWTRRMQNCVSTYDLDNCSEEVADSRRSALHFAALKGCRFRRNIMGCGYDDTWLDEEYSIETLTNFITDYESEEAHETYEMIHQERVRDRPVHLIPFDESCAPETLSILREKGADVSKLNRKGQTCLHLASAAGNSDAVSALVHEGCGVTLLDTNGLSPLHHAVQKNHPEIVQFMLKHQKSSIPGLDNGSLLEMRLLHCHLRSMLCSVEMIDVLLEHGYRLSELDENGHSALSLSLNSRGTPWIFMKRIQKAKHLLTTWKRRLVANDIYIYSKGTGGKEGYLHGAANTLDRHDEDPDLGHLRKNYNPVTQTIRIRAMPTSFMIVIYASSVKVRLPHKRAFDP